MCFEREREIHPMTITGMLFMRRKERTECQNIVTPVTNQISSGRCVVNRRVSSMVWAKGQHRRYADPLEFQVVYLNLSYRWGLFDFHSCLLQSCCFPCVTDSILQSFPVENECFIGLWLLKRIWSTDQDCRESVCPLMASTAWDNHCATHWDNPLTTACHMKLPKNSFLQ